MSNTPGWRLFLGSILLAAGSVGAADVERVTFGRLDDGTAVDAVELSNDNGLKVRILALGATIQALEVPDRDGNSGDIVLGYPTAMEYLEKPQYFGSTVGRFANRIAGGQFELDGKTVTLETNDGPNHLHGGLNGLDKVLWEIEDVTNGPLASVRLRHVSPDGAGGYPGELTVTAVYTLNDEDEFGVEYRAETDRKTIVNITNHAYFNLSGAMGEHSILDHELALHADHYTPVDATLIPTGEVRSVEKTPFDFRTARRIGESIRDMSDEQMRFGLGYDHNFVVNDSDGTLRTVAELHDPHSGRVMELLTTAPAVQFYSGNFLDGRTTGKGKRAYRQGDALCLEPQVYPDAPNKPDFPSAWLEPGETYRNAMVFRFSSR